MVYVRNIFGVSKGPVPRADKTRRREGINGCRVKNIDRPIEIEIFGRSEGLVWPIK